MGPWELEELLALDVRFVVYQRSLIDRLEALGQRARLHLKLETGNHRQGLPWAEALSLARRINAHPQLILEGVCSHYANVEDTTDHSYARAQLRQLRSFHQTLSEEGLHVSMCHIANSAATILWPEDGLSMARVGISAYGYWPSRETLAAARARSLSLSLQPALQWQARIAQLKEIDEGAAVGYGCTWRSPRPAKIAVIPAGYAEGYPRALSNLSHMLVHGRRAPLRGRVCMNLTMIEVTDIPSVQVGDEVTLLGAQGTEYLSADQLASWGNTINYEILARLSPTLSREVSACAESL